MKSIEHLAHTLKPFQIEKLLEIVVDFQWMAQRYCDGRMSYAAPVFNDHTRVLQSMEIPLNTRANEVVFAQDGMGRQFDKLTENEANLSAMTAADEALSAAFSNGVTLGLFDETTFPSHLKRVYDNWRKAYGYE